MPQCGIRQYTAAAPVEQPRCIVCDHPLVAAKPPGPVERERATAEGGESR